MLIDIVIEKPKGIDYFLFILPLRK